MLIEIIALSLHVIILLILMSEFFKNKGEKGVCQATCDVAAAQPKHFVPFAGSHCLVSNLRSTS